jgi:hypothetical protein
MCPPGCIAVPTGYVLVYSVPMSVWAALFLGAIRTVIWSFELSNLRTETVKRVRASLATHPRKPALMRLISGSKLQTRPLVREGAP